MMEIRVNRQYRLGPKIGSGSFGEIFAGSNISTGIYILILINNIRVSCHSTLMRLIRTCELSNAILVIIITFL